MNDPSKRSAQMTEADIPYRAADDEPCAACGKPTSVNESRAYVTRVGRGHPTVSVYHQECKPPLPSGYFTVPDLGARGKEPEA